ncbi:transcriptional regulator [Halobacteria archaeon AArc-m2/3/4]|uniref:Transcriptional regulator n=1 Tax=Natronoglomus mannanivorans TaxID=2979990 RepID=A0ABT2Q975_9EURY|nr:transcriptional regulator [Halobacteria archaeon AArc-m2/3/4]
MDTSSYDSVFDALAASERRQLLIALLEHDHQETSILLGVPWRISQSDDERVRHHHVHLPKLEEYGFIEWDRAEQRVTKGDRFDEIEPVVELLCEHQTPVPDY